MMKMCKTTCVTIIKTKLISIISHLLKQFLKISKSILRTLHWSLILSFLSSQLLYGLNCFRIQGSHVMRSRTLRLSLWKWIQLPWGWRLTSQPSWPWFWLPRTQSHNSSYFDFWCVLSSLANTADWRFGRRKHSSSECWTI